MFAILSVILSTMAALLLVRCWQTAKSQMESLTASAFRLGTSSTDGVTRFPKSDAGPALEQAAGDDEAVRALVTQAAELGELVAKRILDLRSVSVSRKLTAEEASAMNAVGIRAVNSADGRRLGEDGWPA